MFCYNAVNILSHILECSRTIYIVMFFVMFIALLKNPNEFVVIYIIKKSKVAFVEKYVNICTY